jgi:hypothetical protein
MRKNFVEDLIARNLLRLADERKPRPASSLIPIATLEEISPEGCFCELDDRRVHQIQAVFYVWEEPFAELELNPKASAACAWHLDDLVRTWVMKDADAIVRSVGLAESRHLVSRWRNLVPV